MAAKSSSYFLHVADKMICIFLTSVIIGLGLCTASNSSYMRERKTCYTCEYVPPREIAKTVYDLREVEEKHPVTKVYCTYEFEFYGKEEDAIDKSARDCNNAKPVCKSKTVYKHVKTAKKFPRIIKRLTRAGGFAACKGPITPESAKVYGVNDWECNNNCYVRTDMFGRLSRGCYRDELHVNPERLGCHQQGGYTYCFCQGSRCNGHNPK